MDNSLLAESVNKARPLLNLIERRFDIALDTSSINHLRSVCEHYRAKREFILFEHGEACALARDDYAKAVMLSEVTRMILREIQPRPRKKKRK